MNVDLVDTEATELLGGLIAGATRVAPGGWLITLAGGLGAGKTTLVRGFLHALGHGGRVPSPTYTLVEPYDIGGRRILHVDLYRLSDPRELEYLGFRDGLSGDATALVEWPERAGGALDEPDVRISLTMAGNGRRAQLEAYSDRGRLLLTQVQDALPAGLRHD